MTLIPCLWVDVRGKGDMDFMGEIHQIFSYTPIEGGEHYGLGVDVETGEVYWNNKKIIP